MNGLSVSGKSISIIGAARSGVGVAHLLHAMGSTVFVSDNAQEEILKSQVANLKSEGVEYETGGHSERVFNC